MTTATDRTSDEVVMPTKVVLLTSALVAAILITAQAIMFVWYYNAHLAVTQADITVTTIITCTVAIPFISYLAFRSEQDRADLRYVTRVSGQDSLTGLLNRRSFEERSSAILSRFGARRSAGVFLYIDTDNFKVVNDRLGHSAGDEVLRFIGAAITGNIRPTDLAVRLGGDEFGVLLLEADLQAGTAVARRIQAVIAASAAELGQPDLDLSVSIGVAAHVKGTSIEMLMNEADRQLYAAKNRGRNTVLVAA